MQVAGSRAKCSHQCCLEGRRFERGKYVTGSGERNKLNHLTEQSNRRTRNVVQHVKAVPLEAWSGPEGSRKLRFPDFMKTTQEGGKVVSLTHRPPLPQEIFLVHISVRGRIDPRP